LGDGGAGGRLRLRRRFGLGGFRRTCRLHLGRAFALGFLHGPPSLISRQNVTSAKTACRPGGSMQTWRNGCWPRPWNGCNLEFYPEAILLVREHAAADEVIVQL